MTTNSDILIIGAGPVGSYTARRLARQGYKVTLLEKRPDLGGPVCCAGIISPDCVKLLEGEDLPVLNAFSGARVYSPNGQVLELKRNSVQAVALDRGLMDLKLAERAGAAGAACVFGIKATHIKADDTSVTVYTNDNRSNVYRGRLALITAGFNPALTSSLGMGIPADFAVGVQARVEMKAPLPLCIFTSKLFAPGFFSWLEPLEDGTALAGLLCRKNAAAAFLKFINYLKEEGFIISAGKPQYRGVSLKPIPKTYSDRLLVIGDAAGQVKPITGGGIFYGLKAAECAISQIEQAFEHGDFTSANLAGYHIKWKQSLGRDIKLSRLARHAYEKLSQRQIDKAFATIVRTRLVEKLTGDDNLKFDEHGSVVLKIIRTPAFYRACVSTLIPWIK